jgi:hypothetical protein
MAFYQSEPPGRRRSPDGRRHRGMERGEAAEWPLSGNRGCDPWRMLVDARESGGEVIRWRGVELFQGHAGGQ